MTTEAFWLVLATAVFSALWNFLTKKTAASKVVLLWWANLLVPLALAPLMIILTDFSTWNHQWTIFILITSIIYFFYYLALGLAYEWGEMSVVFPIARGTGIIGTALVTGMLGIDTFSHHGWVGVFVVACGVLLIGWHELSKLKSTHAFLAALFTGLTVAAYSVVDKLAVQTVPVSLYGLLPPFLGSVLMTPVIYKRRRKEIRPTIQKHWRVILFIGVASLIPYQLVLHLFRTNPAAYVVALRETSIAIATALGLIFLHEKINGWKMIGVALIITGAVILKLA